ncbi:MAG: hypothetical protein GY701_03705, partial [Sulfitobacter sp.]|nr:hypothetical protein [Sulfitobacter sp.]
TPAETIHLEFAIAAGTTDPTVTFTATSQDNPVTNDPDPTNNTTTINLT